MYLASSNASSASRPKLNLSVKSELKGMGGKIVAQSSMAEGPDGTSGFKKGWTKRLSKYVAEFVPQKEAADQVEETTGMSESPTIEEEEGGGGGKEEDKEVLIAATAERTELKLNPRAAQRF